MENIKINIPEGFEIDQIKSNFIEGNIVFKKKEITYKDIAKELFLSKTKYHIDDCGLITQKTFGSCSYKDKVNCTSKEQVEKLLAMNQLMNVAKYLNGDWRADFKKEVPKFFIYINDKNNIDISANYRIKEYFVYFKTKELTKQAIDILGEETIRLALS